jgi:ABC-2 type transport system permease protein
MFPVVFWVRGILENPGDPDAWVRNLLDQLSIIKHPFVATTWTARGISAALNERLDDSLFYLGVVAGNALFVSWLVINLLGWSWAEAFNRVQNGRLQTVIRWAWFTSLVTNVLFFYLPPTARRIMLKDLRGFTRDARQWSQMLIMFGLLVIYALNLNRLPVELQHDFTQGLIAFLNLTTVSLIVATFTTRFIYPLLSLESQQLWLLELLPIRRATLLLVKFVFALTVTSIASVGVMALSVHALNLPPVWARIHLVLALAVCVGLSGLAIGLGARFPVLTHRNPARIASGFGGTINLIASVLFVSVEMCGVALLSVREFRADYDLPDSLSWHGWVLLGGIVLTALLVAAGSLFFGARHFNRLEA